MDITRIKYPKQIVSIGRRDKTLGIEAKLFTPTEQEYNDGKKNPLEMHSKFSVFKFSIISGSTKANNAEVLTANIPAMEMKGIYDKTQAVLTSWAFMKLSNFFHVDESQKMSAAYTQKLTMKKYGNKTPAEILIADPGAKTDLLATKLWLTDHLSKYPKNKEMIAAIDEAIDLLDAGKLDSGSVVHTTNASVPIYQSGIKIPHAKKMDDDGCTNIYTLDILFDTNRDSPFQVKIMNCMAPTVSAWDGSGRITADLSKSKNKTEISQYLLQEEWLKICNQCVDVLHNFEETYFPQQWKLANQFDYYPMKD